MGPIVVEIHWYRQLYLVKVDNMTFTVVDELSNDMVFFLIFEASNVEANHCELLQLCYFTVLSSWPIVLSVSLVVASSR